MSGQSNGDDLIGQQFGNFRIVGSLGAGGMGRVYRARHLHLDREAAVKLLHPHLAADPSVRARFLQEARAASQLDHPHIVRIYDYGEQDGLLYLIMELLTHGSLRDVLREHHDPHSTESFLLGLDLLHQAAEGLAYAHARGMVHRDVKPDNLLLKREPGPDGAIRQTVKVADFGLARLADVAGLTASGATVGTPAYMSPEQCQGRELDHRSDIYSLGIVLYEFAAGRPPFTAKSLSEAIYNHVYVAPPPPSLLRQGIAPHLERVILRCLAKRPEDRFATMEDLSNELVLLVADIEAPSPERDADTAGVPPAEAVGESSREPRPVPEVVDPLSGVHLPRVVVIGPDDGVIAIAPLTGDGLTVGRLDDNDLVLSETGVSRHHLLIDWDGSRATVTDLGSSNGSLLGGVTLPPHAPRPWDPVDELSIGPLRLRMALPVQPAAAAAPAVVPSASAVVAESGVAHSPSIATPQAAPPPLPPRHIPPGMPVDGSSGRGKWLAIAVIVAIVAIAAGVFFMSGGDESQSASGAPRATTTPTATTPIPAAGVQATATVAGPAATPTPPAQASTPSPGIVATTNPVRTGGIAQDGVPTTVTVASPGEQVSLPFTAMAGQRVSVEVTDLSIGPTSAYAGRVAVVAAGDIVIASASLWANESRAFIDVTTLAVEGEYAVRIDPEPGMTGSATVTLRAVPDDVSTPIRADGGAVVVEIPAVAQNARLTFTATAGQRVSLLATGVNIGPTAAYAGRVAIAAADGAVMNSASLWVNEDRAFIDTTTLPVAGDYMVVIDPDGTMTGSVTVQLHTVPPDPVAQIRIDGPAVTVTTTTLGQNALLTFTATAGQRVTVTVTDLLIGPTSAYAGRVSILGAGDVSLASASLWTTESSSRIEEVVLATAGTYTILIDPDTILTGSATVALSSAP